MAFWGLFWVKLYKGDTIKYLLPILAILSQLVASDYIDIHTAYTNGTRVIVQGRIIDTDDKADQGNSPIGSFFNDEKKEEPITMTLQGRHYRGISDDEGYFFFDIEVGSAISRQSIALETADSKSLQKIRLYQPSSRGHLGVISDFDDTIIVSDVTSKGKLIYNTFFKNYKKRKLVKESKSRILSTLKKHKGSAFFVITGSPDQLLHTIDAILDYHDLPARTILTKKIHGSQKDSLSASIAYKYDKITDLVKLYPHIKWVMLGDSGEKDKEIYLKVRKNYPKKVHSIYIRDVKSGKLELIGNPKE